MMSMQLHKQCLPFEATITLLNALPVIICIVCQAEKNANALSLVIESLLWIISLIYLDPQSYVAW